MAKKNPETNWAGISGLFFMTAMFIMLWAMGAVAVECEWSTMCTLSIAFFSCLGVSVYSYYRMRKDEGEDFFDEF